MGNITIREILAADTVSDLVDKVNFNFDQLLLNGGGPQGPGGIQGGIGPIGPRGVVWFTCYDIFNTNATLTGVPGLFFPTWNPLVGPERVNNPTITGFPQFAGDPNRYLPTATAIAPNTYPQYSFIIGTIGKMVKSGDLYLQETDDTFNSYQSFDGDVWEFSAVLNTWSFTGVNIKGDKGDTGLTGATDWVRTTDTTSSPFIDLLRPVVDTGNDNVVRILLGKDDPIVAVDPFGAYTKNLLTLFQDDVNPSTSLGSQLAFTGTGSPEAPTVDPADYANIGTRSNTFNITGFSAATTGYPVNITARAGNVVLSATDPVTATNTATLDSSYRKFAINNAQLDVYCSPSIAPVGTVTHRFSDGLIDLSIIHNQSSTYGPWLSGKSIRMYTKTTAPSNETTYLVLQEDLHNRLGVGTFAVLPPNAKVSIISDFSLTGVAALSAGTTWGSVTNLTEFDSEFKGLSNTAFIQSHIVIGAESTPTKFGNESYNSASLLSSVNIKKGFIGFNTFINNVNTTGALKSMDGYSGQGNFFIGPGKILTVNGNISAALPDNDGKFVIGSSSSLLTTIDQQYTGSKYGSQQFNVNLSIDPALAQVGINTLNLQADFNSLGGAIIGKFKRYSTDPVFGHEDLQINKNIILGHPLGTTTTQPRIVNLTTTSSLYWPITKNSVLINAPTWTSSLNFDSTTDFQRATNISWASQQKSANTGSISRGPLYYYLPSLNSQFKIVHGRVLNNVAQLGIDNPHNVGLGLEIETRTNFVPLTISTTSYMTPIVRDKSFNWIPGNRSILATKRYVPGSALSDLVLFEIGQTGNTAIGESIRYPIFVVNDLIWDGGITGLTDLNGQSVRIEDNTSIQLLQDTNYSKDWSLITSQTLITPKFNRSLHISSIGEITSNISGYQHQKSGYIPAGIIFNTENIVTEESTNISTLFTSFNQRISTGAAPFSYVGFEHQIISGINFHGSYAFGSNNIRSAEPLGIKPGPLVNRAHPSIASALVLKAKDLILSGGDLVYNVKATKLRAGDVYIHGGQIFKNQINATGFIAGKNDLNSPVGPVQEYANYGNIFLGSKNNDSGYQTSPGGQITKAGNVYVGYQSDLVNFNIFSGATIRTAWNTSAANWSPKGDAALNVVATPFNNNRDTSIFTTASNKAINIQTGDIVTYNQPVGWQTVDLTDNAYLGPTINFGYSGASASVTGRESNVIYSYDPAPNLRPARYTTAGTRSDSGTTNPSWKFSYKVIGYTVFWQLSCQSVLWKTIDTNDIPPSPGSQGTFSGGNVICVNMDLLCSISNVPLPATAFTTLNNVYTTGNTTGSFSSVAPNFSTGYNSEHDPTFSGNGYILLRNNRNSAEFPMQFQNTTSSNQLLMDAKISARFLSTPEGSIMYITKQGPWSWFVSGNAWYVDGGGLIPTNLNSKVANQIGNYANGLVHFSPLPLPVADSLGNNVSGALRYNTEVQYDFMIGGTYQLNPGTFFSY